MTRSSRPSDRRTCLVLALAAVLSALAPPSAAAQHARSPGGEGGTASHALTAADYQRAEGLLSQNLATRLYRADVTPNWGGDDRFWYRTRVPGGFEFIDVNPSRGTRAPAFDHAAVAAALSRATGGSHEARRLPFTSFEWAEGRSAIDVVVQGTGWRCDVRGDNCSIRDRERAAPSGVASPDGRLVAFRRDHNLWVHDRDSGEERALTSDGVERHGYATDSQGWRQSDQPILLWSPDSRMIATFRLDEREVGEMHLLRTAEPRPELHSWPYALPSDSIVPMVERVVVHLDGGTGARVVTLDTPADHQRSSSCCGMARGQVWADVEWSEDAGTLAFVSVSRDYRTATLRVADPQGGAVRTVLSESHPVFFESHAGERGLPNWRLLA
ncbi:MAG: hypothetical protein EA350_11395, partial [Gemmatimonadales bacterium]